MSTPVSLTDTHCHLNSPVFDGRMSGVLARAQAAGVGRIVVPGWDRDSSERALALANEYPAIIRPAVGLHPWFASPKADLRWLESLLEDQRVAAIGEIGLDVSRSDADANGQEAVFRAQLALAAERNFPVLIHCHRGWDRLLGCVRDFPGIRGVMHAFSGSRETMRECMQLGLYLSFAGMVTRTNSLRAQQAAAHVPLDRLLLETDAPYMALEGIPADQAEPAHLSFVLRFVANLRNASPDQVMQQVADNTRQLGL